MTKRDNARPQADPASPSLGERAADLAASLGRLKGRKPLQETDTARRALIGGALAAAVPLPAPAASAEAPSDLARACDAAVAHMAWINANSVREAWSDERLHDELNRFDDVLDRAATEPATCLGDIAAKARILVCDFGSAFSGFRPDELDPGERALLPFLREVGSLTQPDPLPPAPLPRIAPDSRERSQEAAEIEPAISFEPIVTTAPVRTPIEWQKRIAPHFLAVHVTDRVLRMDRAEIAAFIRGAGERDAEMPADMLEHLELAVSEFTMLAEMTTAAHARFYVAAGDAISETGPPEAAEAAPAADPQDVFDGIAITTREAAADALADNHVSLDLRAAIEAHRDATVAMLLEPDTSNEATEVRCAAVEASGESLRAVPARSIADVRAKLAFLLPEILPDVNGSTPTAFLENIFDDVERLVVRPDLSSLSLNDLAHLHAAASTLWTTVSMYLNAPFSWDAKRRNHSPLGAIIEIEADRWEALAALAAKEAAQRHPRGREERDQRLQIAVQHSMLGGGPIDDRALAAEVAAAWGA